jgi:hypothetical protein
MFQRIGVGDVEGVRPARRWPAFDVRAQRGHQEAASTLFGLQLLRAHQAPAVADAPLADAELLHHAITVKPVVVALTLAFVQSRAVAVEAPLQVSRPAAAQQGKALQITGAVVHPFEGCEQGLAGHGLRKDAGIGRACQRGGHGGQGQAGGQPLKQITPLHARPLHGVRVTRMMPPSSATLVVSHFGPNAPGLPEAPQGSDGMPNTLVASLPSPSRS